VRVGSVIQILEPTPAQISQVEAQNRPPSPAQMAKVPRHSVRVTGLVITENEFPAGNGGRYDLFPTRAYAAAYDAHTEVETFYDVKLRHGAADQAAFDSQLRPLGSLGEDDQDTDAAAIQRAITPQAVGWWVLAGLIALAGLAVLGQAAARQFSTDVDDHDALSALGLRGRQFVLLGLARAFVVGVAGAAGAVALAAALSPLTPVGEARLATADPGAVSVDPLVTLIGVPAVVAAVLLLSVWPAIRHARPARPDPLPAAGGLAWSVVRAVAAVGGSACLRKAQRGLIYSVLVHAVPGPAGAAALARYTTKYGTDVADQASPIELINFGESVNFPLLFGVALSLFGAATLVHLLLVSVSRRRAEAGLLKVLGFVRRQVAAVVTWQATAVVLVGMVVGVPLGIAAGKVAWRLFATNVGVVPVEVVQAVPLVLLAAAVLAATNLLAILPALRAARSHAADLLRAE
jgi:predicted lysophospholipase L1 biosynthesis ABC-type transport system permease subunit